MSTKIWITIAATALPFTAMAQSNSDLDDRTVEMVCQLKPEACDAQIADNANALVVRKELPVEQKLSVTSEPVCVTEEVQTYTAFEIEGFCGSDQACKDSMQAEGSRDRTCIGNVESRAPMSGSEVAALGLSQASYTKARENVDATSVGRIGLSVTFESGSDRLTYDSYAEIDRFVQAVGEIEGRGWQDVYEIQGHTDSAGHLNGFDNKGLSQRRADAVSSALIDRGLDASSLQAKGYAFEKPLNGYDASSPENRRVEVVVLK